MLSKKKHAFLLPRGFEVIVRVRSALIMHAEHDL
jgi:hypothetical protein